MPGEATTRVVPLEAYPVGGGRTPLYTGVAVGPWTYVRGANGREEVYYRTVDPYQLTNLRRDPRYVRYARALRRLSDVVAGCAGAACPSEFTR